MKIIKVNGCYDCQYSIYSNLSERWFCFYYQHPYQGKLYGVDKTRYIGFDVKKNPNKVPDWCPLEDPEKENLILWYKEFRNSSLDSIYKYWTKEYPWLKKEKDIKKNIRIEIIFKECYPSEKFYKVIDIYQEDDFYCISHKTDDGRDIVHKFPLADSREIIEMEIKE